MKFKERIMELRIKMKTIKLKKKRKETEKKHIK